MIACLKTLELDIEATAEDPSVGDKLPEIEVNDVVMGTMSPYLRKFLSLIDKRQSELQKMVAHIQTLPAEIQKLRLGDICRANAFIDSLVQIFWIEVADELTKTSTPDFWNQQLFYSVKKGWRVTGVAPADMAGPFVVVVRNTEDENAEADQPDDPAPTDKRRLN